MFWFRKKRKNKQPTVIKESITTPIQENRVLLTREVVDQDEKELVAAITTSIAANDHPHSSFKISSIQEIDVDKERAIAIVSAVLASDKPHSKFRCVSINQVGEGEQLC